MAQPYVGEIRMFAGNFAPAGWMFCEGQLLPISENETLFQLIGTTYGGDGESTFALPDLRGRIPIHQGNGFILAETGGAEEVTLTDAADPGPQPPAASAATATARPDQPRRQRCRRSSVQRLRRTSTTPPTRLDGDQSRSGRRRQPAAHELPAVPLRRLHHLAVRHLPDPDLGADMADPFVAEIRIFPFNFAPKGWAWCDGQLLPISQNTALFSLLGTTYGGDGKTTFALPDLQGSAPMHPGQGPGLSLHDLGETGGCETVTLLAEPRSRPTPTRCAAQHRRSGDVQARRPTRVARPLEPGRRRLPSRRSNHASMAPQALAPAGGDQPHNNMQPYLTFYFNIALQGVFPPRT